MLILSRKPDEKIQIGEKVTITIVRIKPNSVQLGIDAPRDMNIVRTELLPNDSDTTSTPAAAPAAESVSGDQTEHVPLQVMRPRPGVGSIDQSGTRSDVPETCAAGVE